MLDIETIRKDPARIKAAAAAKRQPADIDGILAIDGKRRALIGEAESLRCRRNQSGDRIAQLRREKGDASRLLEEMKSVSARIKRMEEELVALEEELRGAMLLVPNVPHGSVRAGRTAEENRQARAWGEKPLLAARPAPHWEIGEKLGIIDFARAAKISGGGFAMLAGAGALLERALINFMLDLHTREQGYTEIFPPFLVTPRTMEGTGQLPKFEEDMYRLRDDDMFLIPTAEVPVTNMYRDEILAPGDLPIKLTAYTACFRREAGSYGKETRGMIRVHQFNKVEMVEFAPPERSYEELESLLADAEEVFRRRGLQYRVMELCAGDLSFAASKCYDIEVWAPGVGRYLEASSCSNFEDFQARRANIRFRALDNKVRFVHTLNGSGVALPRTMIALLETYQTPEGTVRVPEALRPYMGGMEIIE